MPTPSDPWDAGVGGIPDANPVEPAEVPGLAMVAEVLFVRLLAAHTLDDDRRRRINLAADELSARVASTSHQLPGAAGVEPPDGTVDELQARVKGRLPEGACVALLVAAAAGDPVSPYEIKLHNEARDAALADLARALGCPRIWAEKVAAALERARHAQPSKHAKSWVGPALAIGFGVLAIPLALAFTQTSGSSASSGRGASALMPADSPESVRALVSGSAAEVYDRVVMLHAAAILKHELRPGTKSRREQEVLQQMLGEIRRATVRHEAIDDDGSAVLRLLTLKRKAVERAQQALRKDGLLDG